MIAKYVRLKRKWGKKSVPSYTAQRGPIFNNYKRNGNRHGNTDMKSHLILAANYTDTKKLSKTQPLSSKTKNSFNF